MSMVDVALQRTALYDKHVELGGRMVPFAGWEMPVQYAGVIAEHEAVRNAAGMFDVSHMGQILVSGPASEAFLQFALSNDITRIKDGEAQYTLLMNADGGITDDLIAYRLAPDEYMLVVNASNNAVDLSYLQDLAVHGEYEASVSVADESSAWAMIAVQGPTSLEIVNSALGLDLTTLPPFTVLKGDRDGCPLLAATTGYTGERGCEIMVPPQSAQKVWERLLDAGVVPCGLGARDTLRLEVCYPLHGQEITSDTSPISAKLGWVCALGTGFVGEDHVAALKAAPAPDVLTALRATERGVLRPGMAVRTSQGIEVGSLTSGTQSPTLNAGIGMGYIDRDYASVGTQLVADVRGRDLPIEVVAAPFVRGSLNQVSSSPIRKN